MIEIFGSPTCKKCLEAKAFFTEKGIEFVEYDVKSDTARKDEMVAATGMLGLPQIRIGQDWYIGFDPDKMAEKLGLQKLLS